MKIVDGVLKFVNQEDLIDGKFIVPKGVNKIGMYAFSGLRSFVERDEDGNIVYTENSPLTEVIIPEGVTSIGNYAFQECVNLKKITLPESLISISQYAFAMCRSLKEIILPNGLRTIENRAFLRCYGLTEIKLPESVTTIEEYAFACCKSLERIEIPESVTIIEEGAFEKCNSLKEINIRGIKFEFSQYEIQNEMQGTKIENLLGLIIQEKIEIYDEIVNLSKDIEDLYPAMKNDIKERIKNFISIIFNELEIDDNIEEKIVKAKQRIEKWIEKEYIPSETVFREIPIDKIAKFDKNIWFKLANNPIFNESEESKSALVELAYVFGIFEKDKYTVRGTNRTKEEINEGDRIAGNVHNYQKRIEQILRLIDEGKLNGDNLHIMFDGTNMEYNPAFYKFFLDNEQEIFASYEIMELIPNIQRAMLSIMHEYDGRIPTIEECKRYLNSVIYIGQRQENGELARLCELTEVSLEKFLKYQDLYEKQKQRNKENTIPQVQNKNYRMLDLTDPKALVIGEDNFSDCCQRLGDTGDLCMQHSVLSENGRIFEVFDDDGALLAQSWVWRNGNVVCFDSVEADAIQEGRYSKAEQKNLVNKVERAYREAAKQMIDESENQIRLFREKKLAEIDEMKITEEEKKEMRKQLERICDESRIKRVTLGRGVNSMAKEISDRFSSNEVDTSNGRVKPRESVDYLNDSDTQYVIMEVDDLTEIKTDEAQIQVKYRDKRTIKKEKGYSIAEKTIFKIKLIESQSHKPQMQLMDEVDSIENLSGLYEVKPEELRIIHGKDWYYVYSNNEYNIHVHDLARNLPDFIDEKMIATREIAKGLDMIVQESIEEDKPISAELREDTSYIEFLELVEAGYLEQIGDDVAFEFEDEYGEQKIISREEQEDLLNIREEIRKRASNEETTIMHSITFRPTERYKKVLERRKGKEM